MGHDGMESYFADTTYIVATVNIQDREHARAERLSRRLAEGELGNFRLVMTDYIFDEVVTAILTRTRRHDLAARTGRSLNESGAWRLVHLTAADFEASWTMFLDREDKLWSFTDCTSFSLMERLGLRTAIAFDENFTQAGFALLA